MSGIEFASLSTDSELDAFDCGNDDMNSWLRRHALASEKADLARTALAVDNHTVVG